MSVHKENNDSLFIDIFNFNIWFQITRAVIVMSARTTDKVTDVELKIQTMVLESGVFTECFTDSKTAYETITLSSVVIITSSVIYQSVMRSHSRVIIVSANRCTARPNPRRTVDTMTTVTLQALLVFAVGKPI